jgi:hypothetical protein
VGALQQSRLLGFGSRTQHAAGLRQAK